MNTLRHFNSRLPLTALLLPLVALISSCSRRNADGSLATWGVLLLILDIVALVNIFNKPWGIGKKLIWGAIVFFFPLGGLIIYYFFGRNSD
jgi:hypothetical protein